MIKLLKNHKYFCNLMEAKKSTARRDKLISLQTRARNIWNRYQYFSVEPSDKPKFFITFPYAYMNGKLHLGHAFSMTKCDFNAWYKRLCGFNVLFPFGYHCTGMPISAASLKLKEQLQKYGNPPQNVPKELKTQYDILKQMRVNPEEIKQFVDPYYWVKYFPPLAKVHLTSFGVHVDHARSFVTTDINPYYNSFIEWQFGILKSRGYIKFGKRASIYSPKDKQMCADHDRREGEGINPDQYTLIKIKVVQLNQVMKEKLNDRKVFLVAATLRPQTMYGQTNCYLLPTGEYVAVEMKNDEVFICSERSARNMAYQGLTKEDEKVEIIARFKGEQMMGLPLEGPLAIHKCIYTVPMMTVSMKKGTGVVSCVPSDSPDDWMAISDLRNKEPLRKKYNITEDMVKLDPIEIIQIPGLGRLSALKVCQDMNIKSQNDKDNLALAKDQCYKRGFHDGVMVVGAYSGKKVVQAKNLVRKDLIDGGHALIYYQPGGNVVSRSGDECVVAYCDQWYINYADQDWKKRVMNHVVNNFKTNSQNLHNDLVYTINWLKQWGCSRSFGLGTKMPFDKQYLIESLSDSTIYFAFYTIAHLLQGNIFGSEPGILGIKSEDLTEDFWDFVLLGKQYKSNKVPLYKLQKLRQSFLYWYPMDLRCSGKDLIKNHLTMSLFNHAAIWEDEPDKWPRGFYCNGFIMVNGEKMSKSTGNFKTLQDIVQQYGADSSRLGCAQAGDSINDANFTSEIGNAAILQLSTLQMFMNKSLEQIQSYRRKEDVCEQARYFDQIFENELQDQIRKVKDSYQSMVYRDVVKHGLHDFVSTSNYYLINCHAFKPRRDLIERYIFLQLLFLYPICPHFCEVSYIDYFLPLAQNSKDYPSLLGNCKFPTPKGQINYGAIRSHEYFIKFMINARQAKKKVSKPKKGGEPIKFAKAIIIYRAKFQDYQLEVLKLLSENVNNQSNQISPKWRENVKIQNAEQKKRSLMFGAFVAKEYQTMGKDALADILPFDELKTLDIFLPIIKQQMKMEIQIIEIADAPNRDNKGWKQQLSNVTPGNPTIIFE